MGKGQKRKNPGVGVDFRRVKHKVGKKLPRAQNETDTSFKSRSINLPDQSVLADKSGAAVTSRNLTLKDLLGQCGHYSDKVRREAVQGLAELVAAHPQELTRHTTLVMETLAERITDGDKAVRAALRTALASPILPAMGAAALGPFVPLLMAHVCSAMTHLADAIRADALGFMELLAEWRPDLVAAAFLAPALHHFGDLLSKGSRGRSLSAGSLAALHRVVAALERFLSRVAPERPHTPGAAAASAGPAAQHGTQGSGAAAGAHDRAGTGGVPLRRARCDWGPLAAGGPAGAALLTALPASSGATAGPQAASRGGSAGAPAGDAAGAAAEEAARGALRHLLDCWSDCGPAQLATAPELALAQCLVCTLRSADHLLRRFGPGLAGSPGDRASLAHALVKKVAPVFPLHAPAVPPPASVAEALVQLNVAAAQLLARFLPAQLSPGPAAGPEAAEASGWPARLLDWFEAVMVQGGEGALPAAGGGMDELLQPEAAAAGPAAAAAAAGTAASAEGNMSAVDPQAGTGGGGGKKGGRKQRGQARDNGSGGSGRAAQQAQQLPAEVYEAALEGVWGVLPLVSGPRRRALLAAVWALWERSGVRSATRAQVLRFWRRLLADPAPTFFTPLAPNGEPLVFPQEALQWLQALPRFLWELGGSSAAATESAMRLLLDGARFACCAGDPAAGPALAGVQHQLAPLFATLLPVRPEAQGKRKAQQAQQGAQQQQQRVLAGPLAQQPHHVQRVAVDVLANLPGLQESTLRTAALLCLTDAYPTDTALRLLEAVARKAAASMAVGGCGGQTTVAAAAAAAAASAVDDSSSGGGFGCLLLCLLGGRSQAGVECGAQGQEAGWRRHEAVVHGACGALLGSGCAGELAEALAGPLLDLCLTPSSSRPLHGTLGVAAALAGASDGSEQGQHGEGSTRSAKPSLPPALVAELPGVLLCYTALCEAAHPGAPAAAAGDAAVDAAAGVAAAAGAGPLPAAQPAAGGREWRPPPSEAAAFAARLLAVLPSLVAPTLECISATAAQQGAQRGGSAHSSSGDAAVAPSSAASSSGSSQVVGAWLAASGAAGEPGREGQHQPVHGPDAASWAAATVRLLQTLLEAPGPVRQVLLDEEARAEAALCACEAAMGWLDSQGHPAASRLKQGTGAARTLFNNLMGRQA